MWQGDGKQYCKVTRFWNPIHQFCPDFTIQGQKGSGPARKDQLSSST